MFLQAFLKVNIIAKYIFYYYLTVFFTVDKSIELLSDILNYFKAMLFTTD